LKNTGIIIIYAPGIYSGGGLIILNHIIDKVKDNKLILILDEKFILESKLKLVPRIFTIKKSFFHRIYHELKLSLFYNTSDHLICLSNIPPLFGFRGRLTVFQQNALILDNSLWDLFPLKLRLKFFLQSRLLKFLKGSVNNYLVQTDLMSHLLKNTLGISDELGRNCVVSTLNFSDIDFPAVSHPIAPKKFDFIYVADGQPHKNHSKLVEALILLKMEGLNISLALTIDETSTIYNSLIFKALKYDLSIIFLGNLSRQEIFFAYHESSCLIYPSLIESFGLPLLEAASVSLPIIASELDYVYEVVTPTHTFDPYSASSIARAMKRQMNLDNYHQRPNKFGVNFTDYLNGIGAMK